MTWVLPLLIGLTILYVVITISLTIGIERRVERTNHPEVPVTVLICAHNEADRIGRCMQALASQTYPAALTEIIVVDDRSTDGTAEAVSAWRDRIQNLQIVSVESTTLHCPKKNALLTGSDRAAGDLILTTDADCSPAPGWIASTVSAFATDTGVVIGPSPLTDPGGKFGPLLAFQSLLVNALAAGSAGIGFPLTCSGRNLAFRREAFAQSGGYQPIGHIIGGDDVLLMRRIAALGWDVHYNDDPEATVASPAHLDHQWSRQIRYQSKARHYGVPILSVAVLIYILHVLLLAGPLWVWLAPHTIPTLCSVLLLKAAVDGVFLWRAARRLGYRRLLYWFPVVEVLTIPYVAVFCALGTMRPSSWT
jgi:cellulose synthase/poly-beta-1,6-N-acetylglucosamine synthase-like glycosyltransferase